ncbi:MAG: hypothetical protein JSR77_10470 [Planctomycetes bacterium]|nr:hypothetical protein [Planctomycetota bacterium]
MKWIWTVVAILCLGGLAFVPFMRGEADRSTPEAAIRAARDAVMNGDARRLGDYIYYDNDEMRRLMRRFGVFLGNVQDLGDAIQKAFPAQVAELKAKAEEAAKAGKTTSLLAQMTSQFRPQGGRRKRPDGPPPTDARNAFDDALKSVFADPYGWLRESEAKLTTVYHTDDQVMLMWEEKPIMPPIGMYMKKAADNKWYFLLPTNLPGISNFMPRTKEQFQIFGGLITVFDNVVIDLTKDVKSGRLRSLDDVSRKAGEKTFIPAAMTVFAYTKLMESQKKEAAATTNAAAPAVGK